MNFGHPLVLDSKEHVAVNTCEGGQHRRSLRSVKILQMLLLIFR